MDYRAKLWACNFCYQRNQVRKWNSQHIENVLHKIKMRILIFQIIVANWNWQQEYECAAVFSNIAGSFFPDSSSEHLLGRKVVCMCGFVEVVIFYLYLISVVLFAVSSYLCWHIWNESASWTFASVFQHWICSTGKIIK